MKNSVFVIDNFNREKQNKIIENYQIIISNETIYLLNSSNNYGNFTKSIFSGIGDITDFFGDTFGFIGGLASELTGNKLSKMLSKMSANRSKAKLNKIIKNLDSVAGGENGIDKIEFSNIKQIVIKKGFLINGKSYVEFYTNELTYQLFSKKREDVNKLAEAIRNNLTEVKVRTKYV